jgi:hypothetical protein
MVDVTGFPGGICRAQGHGLSGEFLQAGSIHAQSLPHRAWASQRQRSGEKRQLASFCPAYGQKTLAKTCNLL